MLIVDEPGIVYKNLSSALQLDVAPTIVDRLSLPVPKTWRRQTLLSADQRQVSFHYRGFEAGERAVIYRQGDKVWKYIRHTITPREELYELRSDPREERNLAEEIALAKTLDHMRALMRHEENP
jgi:arylsulfatase A-like enzyme